VLLVRIAILSMRTGLLGGSGTPTSMSLAPCLAAIGRLIGAKGSRRAQSLDDVIRRPLTINQCRRLFGAGFYLSGVVGDATPGLPNHN
jgi:hypothetical protein